LSYSRAMAALFSAICSGNSVRVTRNTSSWSNARRSSASRPLEGPNAVIRIEGQFVLVLTGRRSVSFMTVVDECNVPHDRIASSDASSVPVNGLGTVGARK